MEPRPRIAVSTYLEVFILIAVATAGSALVFSLAANYEPVAQGPSVTVSDASIRQGFDVAVEKVVVANTGTVSFSSFTISTAGIASNQFYVALSNAATGATMTPSPASGTSPAVITETVTIYPGASVVISITVVSASEFTVGASYPVIVSTSAGSEQGLSIAASPA